MIIHEYTAPVSKALYEEYGQIETSLLMQDIQSLGIHFEGGFRCDNGEVYHHMILVMTPRALDNLHELFPGITTPWSHNAREHTPGKAQMVDPYIVHEEKGKLHVSTKDVTFRI